MTQTPGERGLAPTLGRQVVDWIHDDAELVHGAGAVQGRRVDWSDDLERLAVVYRAYELHPAAQCRACGRWNVDVPVWDYPWTCPAAKCGERLPPVRAWTHYRLSRPKGWSKSGAASKLVVVEACGPSRFDGWDAAGEPVARPVARPVINCFATEENQAGETYAAAATIFTHLAESSWCRRSGYKIDPGISQGEKSTRTFIHTPYSTVGVAQPRTSSDSAAEGGQPTFNVADETHLWVRPALKRLYETEVLNLGKGDGAGWLLETSTMYQPGKGSVAEDADRAAEADDGASGIYVDHRGAPDTIDVWADRDKHIPDPAKLEEATRVAYGGAFPWAVNMPQRVRLFARSNLDQAELERKYLNWKVEQADAFVFRPTWNETCDRDRPPGWVPDDGEHVVLGFDGSLTDDHTGLVGVHVPTATLFVAGHWDPSDHPTDDYPEGHVPESDVDAAVNDAWRRWAVSRMYPDPPHWQSWVAKWARRHGKGVKPFDTISKRRTSPALKAFSEAVTGRQLRHTGHPALTGHVTAAVKIVDQGREDPELNPDGKWWRIAKPRQTRHDPSVKIDLAMCAVLAWAAYLDAIAAGEGVADRQFRSMFV